MKIKHFCLALGLTTIGSAASIFSPIATLPAKALTWTLSNVRFNDGAVATGSFDYLGGSGQASYQNFNIIITGPKFGGTRTFADANSRKSVLNNGTRFRLSSPSFSTTNPYFYLNFAQPLLTSGNGPFNISLVPSSGSPNSSQDVSQYGLYNQSNQVNLIGGNVTSSAAVPFEFWFSCRFGDK